MWSCCAGHACDTIGAIIEKTCGESRRKGGRGIEGLNAWVGDMTGDESFDAEALGRCAEADGPVQLTDAFPRPNSM
ncbi:MAG: hypothetical protein ACFNLW_04585 [Olsenella sp.]